MNRYHCHECEHSWDAPRIDRVGTQLLCPFCHGLFDEEDIDVRPAARVTFLASLRSPRVRAFLEALPPDDLARRRAFVAEIAREAGETPPEEAYLVDPDPPALTEADREWVEGVLEARDA